MRLICPRIWRSFLSEIAGVATARLAVTKRVRVS
jgi:hypothetical protein